MYSKLHDLFFFFCVPFTISTFGAQFFSTEIIYSDYVLRLHATPHSKFNSMVYIEYAVDVRIDNKMMKKVYIFNFFFGFVALNASTAHSGGYWIAMMFQFRVNDRLHFVTLNNRNWPLHQCVADCDAGEWISSHIALRVTAWRFFPLSPLFRSCSLLHRRYVVRFNSFCISFRLAGKRAHTVNACLLSYFLCTTH